MAVIHESNRIPLEPAMAAPSDSCRVCGAKLAVQRNDSSQAAQVSASSLAPSRRRIVSDREGDSLSGPSLNEWTSEI